MEIIDNVGKWYRAYSKQALTAIVAFQGSLLALPDGFRNAPIPRASFSISDVINTITVVVAVIGLFGSFIKQPELHAPAAELQPDLAPSESQQ